MKITSIKNIYLKEYELKQAIIEYLEKTEPELAQHLYDNSCSMDWGSHKPLLETDKESEYFVISIDGEIEEEDCSGDIKEVVTQVESAAIKAVREVMGQHSKAFEKLAGDKKK